MLNKVEVEVHDIIGGLAAINVLLHYIDTSVLQKFIRNHIKDSGSVFFINTNTSEIPRERSRVNMVSSHAKITRNFQT